MERQDPVAVFGSCSSLALIACPSARSAIDKLNRLSAPRHDWLGSPDLQPFSLSAAYGVSGRLLPASSWCTLARRAELPARMALFARGRYTQNPQQKTRPGRAGLHIPANREGSAEWML